MLKKCSSCKIEKPLEEFHKDKQGTYGVRCYCKECYKSIDKKRRNTMLQRTTILDIPLETIFRRCAICKIDKSLVEFSNSKYSKYGKGHWCKECNKMKQKDYKRKLVKNRRCTSCGKKLLENELQKCDTCRNKKINLRKELKQQMINYLGGKCNRCGFITEYQGAYSFHHRNPLNKSFEISTLINSNIYNTDKELILKELDKCELLCENCHRIEHFNIKNREKLLHLKRFRLKKKAIELKGGKCQRCGLVTEQHSVYDFHHVSGNKKGILSKMFLKNKWNDIKAELDKCILVCGNCHQILHEKLKENY